MRWTQDARAVRRRRAALASVTVAGILAANVAFASLQAQAPAPAGFGPGSRSLLDAHNAYPERGRFADRITRALATGTPVAIEQDLHWVRSASGAFQIVVAHDDDALDGAPTLEAHFFERIRPLMDSALASNRRDGWPLVTLNLDFKSNTPALHDAVWELLGRYERWLTVARKGAWQSGPHTAADSLRVGPLLVLTGQDTGQRRRFYEAVPVGGTLRLFGALPVAPARGVTRAARAAAQVRIPVNRLIARRADEYTRWVNLPWLAVEEGGAAKSGTWTAADSARLTAIVERAHRRGFWMRFYTLDSFDAASDQGYTASYNFGSIDAARVRWRAALGARVDFVATDQYELFAAFRSTVSNVHER